MLGDDIFALGTVTPPSGTFILIGKYVSYLCCSQQWFGSVLGHE